MFSGDVMGKHQIEWMKQEPDPSCGVQAFFDSGDSFLQVEIGQSQ